MTGLIRIWIMRLTSTAVLTACAMALTPDGRVKKTVKAICGIVTMLALISPLATGETVDIESVFSSFRREAIEVSGDFSEINEKISSDIIVSETEAYISDKGKSLGIDGISVTVTVKKREDGYFHPYSAEIAADAGRAQIKKLGEIIESELGIPEERIGWSDTYD